MPNKTYLDLTGLQTFLNNLKYNYAQGSEGYVVGKAAQLNTARTITLSGAVSGSASFDGSENITITTTGAGEANVIETIKVRPSGGANDGSDDITLSPSSKAVTVDLSTYALKSDITAVMKFKGTKTSDELGALTGMVTGDVYSIVSGGTGTTYKVGSEYAYDGSAWVELGPVIDLSGYVTTGRTVNSKALSSDIVLDGSDIALSSGYTTTSLTGAPAAADSIDTAIGKLQNEIAGISVPVTDVQTKTTSAGSYASVLDGTVAKIDLSGYALSTDLPTVATAIADNDSGYATGDQVYDYVEAHKADAVTITTVKVNGSALTPDANKAVDITVPTVATAIADSDTGYATGDQVYDYIEAMAISDATINALFPANPSSGS